MKKLIASLIIMISLLVSCGPVRHVQAIQDQNYGYSRMYYSMNKELTMEVKDTVLNYIVAKIRSHIDRFEFESNSLECWLTIDARALRDWIRAADLDKLGKFIEVRDNAPHVKKIVFEKTSSLVIKSLVNLGRLEYVGKRECGWAQGEQIRADSKPEGKRNGGKAGHRSDYSYIDGSGKRVRVEVKHRGAWFMNQEGK